MFLARAVPPSRLARVRQEHDRPDHAVGQCLRVAVDVIGLRPQHALAVGFVVDEGDRAVVAAKRGAGQRQPSGGVAVRLAHGLAPGLRVAAVVDLVEHDERAVVLGAHPVPGRVARDLGVGDDDAVVLRRGLRRAVGELRVERDPDTRGGKRPLGLEVFGGYDDGDLVDGPVGQELAGDAQGKRRLT